MAHGVRECRAGATPASVGLPRRGRRPSRSLTGLSAFFRTHVPLISEELRERQAGRQAGQMSAALERHPGGAAAGMHGGTGRCGARVQRA